VTNFVLTWHKASPGEFMTC